MAHQPEPAQFIDAADLLVQLLAKLLSFGPVLARQQLTQPKPAAVGA